MSTKQWCPFKYDLQGLKTIVTVTYAFWLPQLNLAFRVLITSPRQIVFTRPALTTRLNQVYLELVKDDLG